MNTPHESMSHIGGWSGLAKQLHMLFDRYSATLEQLSRLLRGEPQKPDHPRLFESLQTALLEIKDSQPVYRAVVELWQQQTATPPEAIRRQVADVQATLGRLLEVIGQLEVRLAASRRALLPQLDQATRKHHARNAYAHVGRGEAPPSRSESE